MHGTSIVRILARLAATALVVVCVTAALSGGAPAAPKPEPAPTDEPMTVTLIDGTVYTLDVGMVGQLAAAVANPTEPGIVAALVQILNAASFPPTAVLLIAAYRLNPNLVTAIAEAAAQSNRQDKEEALRLFAFESGVDWEQIVAGVGRVDQALAAALSDYFVGVLPQNPRPPEDEPSFARNTAENPNRITPQTPGEQDQQTQQVQ